MSGSEFNDLVKQYIVTGLERGIPSLFVDVKSLYDAPEKMTAVGEIIEEITGQLEAETSLHQDGMSLFQELR